MTTGITAQGSKELKRYRETGKKLTRAHAMKAKCYECQGGYADGKQDCKVTSCPLYPYMPYREKK